MSSPDNTNRARPRDIFRIVPYPWVVVVLALVSQMGGSWPGQGLPAVYPFIQQDLDLSRAEVGLISSALLGGAIATVFLGGWLSDVLGVKRVMVGFLVVLGLVMMGFWLVHSYLVLLLVGVLAGIAEGPGYPTSTKAIMEWIPQRTRGLAMGIKQMGVALGGAIAAAALPAIALAAGWRVAAVIMGGAILLIAVIFAVMYRDADHVQTAKPRMSLATLRALAQDRGLIIATLWGVIIVGIQTITLSYIALFLIDVVHMPKVAAGGYLAVAQLSSVIARVCWGGMSDFMFGSRRNIVLGILSGAAALGLAGISMVNAETPTAILLLLVILVGATVLSWAGLFAVLVGELAGTERAGVAVGAVNTLQRASLIVMPPLFGLLVDASDSYALAWRTAAGMTLAATVALLLFGQEPRRREQGQPSS